MVINDELWSREQRLLLEKCARTTLSSKLIARQREFFAKIVVDAVLMLDELLPLNMYVGWRERNVERVRLIFLGLESRKSPVVRSR